MTDTLKAALCDALAATLADRNLLRLHDYETPAEFSAAVHRVITDRRDARVMLAAVRHSDGIAGLDVLRAASSANGGRLILTACALPPHDARVSFAHGNYAEELPSAVCAVLTEALRTGKRQACPELTEIGAKREFRRDFGSGIQQRRFER